MKSKVNAKKTEKKQVSKLQNTVRDLSLAPDVSTLIQSPYLNLQAAGSIGIDSSKGVHLRWFLDGYVGENHLPKGNYAANNRFFNKRNDFVRLYRIPYDINKKLCRTLGFFNEKPAVIHNNERLWIYMSGGNIFYLRFIDALKYQEVLALIDPNKEPQRFISKYGHSVFELELKNQLSFAINFTSRSKPDAPDKFKLRVRTETFSVENRSFAEDKKIISARRKLLACECSIPRVVAENIKSIRFSIDSGAIENIEFETYDEFLHINEKKEKLQFIGEFALTKETEIAFSRLEDNTRFKIHHSWLKFNDNAFVNAGNYRDRWSVAGGVRDGVREYITLSDSDPTATVIYNDELDSANTTAMEVSLQKFLNIASIDFHIARMLGLGYIDTFERVEIQQQFIYLAEYHTDKDPENFELEKSTRHLYLSLPTGILDQRPPEDLKLEPVAYGLSVENGTDTPLQITDSQGYAPYERLRYIKLKAALKEDYQQSVSFFNPPLEFQSSDFSSPVFIGFENKKEDDADWIKPEISHDDAYKDTNGNFETKSIFFNKNDKPDYIHEVTTEGVDEYAAYSINIFSRASGVLSNIRKTDKTIFKKANTLKAPTGITVQIIQAEDPLLLTSQAEQTWLQTIDAAKTEILCRLTFDYYHIHDLNYRYGDTVRIFHKKQLPLKVIGSLTTIDNNDPNNPSCILNTGNFSYLSDGQTFVPKIDPAIKNKFIGGNLTYQSKNYIVEDIIVTNTDGTYPKIKIRKNETREAVLTNGHYQLMQVFQAPVADTNEGFLLIENLSKAANWSETTNNQFSLEVALGLSSWSERTETYQDSEGNQKQETVKGIWDAVKITPLAIQDGLYEIEFNTTILNNHPQFISPDNLLNKASVNWYRGFIRIHTQHDTANIFQRKELKVEQILEIGTGNSLKLVAFDPNFSIVDPGTNIQTGTNILVNFHPGYRVYLRKEDSINFNKTTLLPAENEGTRSSIFGLQTLDTLSLDSSGEAYGSSMSVPALLLVREIKPPQKPRLPIGPSFATPPDFFNKATYSFTTEFEHKPWGMVFCRIDRNKILSCLYKKETIEQILQALPPAGEDAFLGNRWLNLLSFDYGSNAGDFESFPIDDQANQYKFPKPDRADIFTAPFDKPIDVVEKIKDVIFSNLLPLTEQPLIFEYIKGGNYVPQPKRQKITDNNGKILHPSHPDFDQAPMAKKISNTKVLFMDFTLDGNMSSDALYFYVVREVSNSMQFGEPSPFMGPVRLINTKAPERLNLRKMSVQIASVNNNFESAVIFEINKFPKSQEISKIQILRTLNSAEALSARNMSSVKEIELQNLDLSGETISVKDDFQSDSEIPYGIPLYYKLVGVRQINYVDADNTPKNIAVFSEPTKTLLTNVVDAQRPESPTLTVQSQVIVDGVIQQIAFSWNKKCYNGKYRLYFMNDNVWKKIYEIRTNDELQLNFSYDCNLESENSFGEKLYYKFKVDVENTSGLINQTSNIFSFSGN
jgi:hypothetical protein